MKEDCFYDNREKWTFYLIGSDYHDIIEYKITDKRTGLTMNEPTKVDSIRTIIQNKGIKVPSFTPL